MNSKKLKTLVSKIDSEEFVVKVNAFLGTLPQGGQTVDKDIILLYMELLVIAHLKGVNFSIGTAKEIVELRNSFMSEYENRVSTIVCVESTEMEAVLSLHSYNPLSAISEFLEYEIAIAPHRYGDFARLPFRNSKTLPATEKRECLAPFVSVDTVY